MKKKSILGMMLVIFSSVSCSTYHYEQFMVDFRYKDGRFESPLDTFVYVNTYSSKANQIANEQFGDKIWEIHDQIDRYHDYEGLNNIKTINDSYGKDLPIPVSEELFSLLSLGKNLTKWTEGNFHLALGSLIDVWSPYFLPSENAKDIDPEVVRKALTAVPSWEQLDTLLELDEENHTVTFHALEGAEVPVILSLGGIGKGFAVDQSSTMFQEAKEAAYIYAGGSSLVTVGDYPGPDAKEWRLSFANPSIEQIKEDERILFQILFAGDYTFSISGDYQKFFLFEDEEGNLVHRHHILDPHTGYPKNDHCTISLASKDASGAMLDALSTAMFNLKTTEEMQELVSKIETEYQVHLDYFVVDRLEDGYRVSITSHFNQMVKNSSKLSSIKEWNVL